jgi:PLP dependent protein
MTIYMDELSNRIGQIRERIKQAAGRSGRSAEEITLLAVTKNVPPEIVVQAAECGVTEMGENRAQELLQKIYVDNDIKWHFIGHLQTNKVKYILGKVYLIHSLDRAELVEHLQEAGGKSGIVTPVLMQVNVSGETTKGGFDEESAPEWAKRISEMPNLSLQGLMTIPPAAQDPEEARACFRTLRELRDRIAAEKVRNVSMRHLSMGMSGDFETAIEEGATIVRIGTAIFGERHNT